MLRPSASATLAAASSDKSFRSSATPGISSAALHKKPSPSPSIKRGKAERLLKEHGSPPGMRVTAGGRVVPSDLPPLSTSRFLNNGFKPPSLRGLGVGSEMPVQPRPETSNVTRLELVGNQPVLYVGDRAFALPVLDANSTPTSSLASSTQDPGTKPAQQPSTQGALNPTLQNPTQGGSHTRLTDLDLATLKSQQNLKKQELRSVEQTEVLQASHQTEAWRAGMIEKKRSLILELDAMRKQINALEAADTNVPPVQHSGFPGAISTATSLVPPPPFIPQFQQPAPATMYGLPGTASFPPVMMYQPPFGVFPGMQATEHAAFVQNPIQAPQSPGSVSRRSHAIEIKPPREEQKKQVNSTLDPKSPTYEPMAKTTAAKERGPPTSSPGKRSPWGADEISQSDKHEDRAISHKLSLSSIDTTDFFPINTHEHSSTRIAPKVTESQHASNENTAVPSTPEKNWPASPWNEGNPSRSSNKAATKLTSWPEAFGKQPSFSSLKQAATVQSTPSLQERALPITAGPLKSSLTGNVVTRKALEPRTGVEDNWPLVASKPIHHVPSTYQEGYQAGYDHVGIPDSPEVLKGYIQGLLQFLSDESKKGRNNSLRGLVASSTPHDSAVSVSFNHTDLPIGSQENVRSAKNHPGVDMRGNGGYGTHEVAPQYTPYNEAVKEPQVHISTPVMYLRPSDASEKTASTYKQAILSGDSDMAKKNQDTGTTMSHIDSIPSSGSYPRQFSGNQLGSRTYGTPVSMQRFIPTPMEHGTKGPSTGVASSGRPMANQRMSGLDGAMDDLADVILDTHLDGRRSTMDGCPTTEPAEGVKSVQGDTSCLGPSSSKDKGKQKATSSPSRATPGERFELPVPSPSNTTGSPKKGSEHSPAKAKLEQVTNKFRRAKKVDGLSPPPEDKKQRAEKWKSRFQRIKDEEMAEIQEYLKKQRGQ